MNDFAKNYLDLWQEQWSKTASSPEWQRMMAENMLKMQELFSKMPSSGNGSSHDTSAARAAPSFSSPDVGAAMLDEFARRMAELERRIATLEQKAGSSA